MLAGILANRNNIKWHGPRGEGPLDSNYYGCITQLNQRGVHGGVGYKDKVPGLADASMAAVGGWDIRPDKLGDALLDAQVLDYDLVKQVREEMNNKYSVFKGYYDPRFIGTSQHATATHVLSQEEVPDASEALKCIRADIRYFKWKNGVVGHTTVIWSASVEPNSEVVIGLDTDKDLLRSIEMSDEERGGPLPPSLIYATAAIMEGCSFVNGGSQNTLCGGLADLARQQLGVYCLGTDFKAGQTKFKTAAVEYLRTMGLKPKVIASSNHLGNNDMHNLATGKKASDAKLRVKHSIFAPWEEDIDHKVSIMYTPYINDEKRDFVEYTSLGFMSQHHTMVTYTRASDSVLCVPLMVDAAVWCDYFSRKSWQYENVAKALAYLFKVPEGAAKGVDPGFFRQMQELETQVMAAAEAAGRRKDGLKGGHHPKRSVKFKENEVGEIVTEWAIPNNSGIICGGLGCVDMQLLQATGNGGEAIETFAGEKSMGGGSVSMSVKNLARLCHIDPLDDEYMQITPPVISSVVPLCKIGFDNSGDKLLSLLEETGSSCRNVETKFMKSARNRDPDARTGLAVLPIYQDGRRGCFFDAASNASFSASEMVEMMEDVAKNSDDASYGAFLFGYPHLLPEMQGEALAHVFSKARKLMQDRGIIVLDLNGVPESNVQTPYGSMCSASVLQSDPVIGPALSHVDILHMNEDELMNLTGVQLIGDESKDAVSLSGAASMFLKCGVAVVAVTRGKKGCFIKCNNEERFSSSKMLPSTWIGEEVRIPATMLPPGTEINSNGAGDSFTSGLLVAAMLRHTGLNVLVESLSPVKSPLAKKESPVKHVQDLDISINSLDGLSIESPSASAKKLTPYSLYMRENYLALKSQCADDKKTIFSRCHEMWEEETEEMKQMYERRCKEELEIKKDSPNTPTAKDVSSVSSPFQSPPVEEMPSRNLQLANQPMNLETAAQFASLVAARHIDMSSREFKHLNINRIREQSTASHLGLEEI
jgi:myo-inositol-1-phosphate synthase